jgi:hypothetical protein
VTRIAVPALVVTLVVAGFVGAAGWNSSREPLLVMTLTERELPLVLAPRQGDEDRGLQLQLTYEGRYDPLDARSWLSDQRLREIGFALHVPVGSPQAVYTYDHVPARVAWVVLEYDGPQWVEIDRRRALAEPQRTPERHALHSRLVPVDAGVDFETLRRRYPSGHLIVRGVIRLTYVAPEGTGRVLYGMLREVVPQRLTVPRQFRSVIDALPPAVDTARAPRYEVDVAVGALGVPYVRALRTLGRN